MCRPTTLLAGIAIAGLITGCDKGIFGIGVAPARVGVSVLTDGCFYSAIPEILVDPTYQRRGIGRRLMELALERSPRGKVAFAAQPQSVGASSSVSEASAS